MIEPYWQSEDGNQTIYLGDCREILLQMPEVDLVLTDPPYELVAKGGGIGRSRQYLHDIEGFTDIGFDAKLLAPFNNWACFCGRDQIVDLVCLAKETGKRWMLVTWNKPNPTPLVNGNYLPDTEYVIHAFNPGSLYGEYRDRARFIVHPAGTADLHPNQKPIAVISKMIRVASFEGQTILDPFMGSGTTLVAAKRLRRKAIGIEIERKYCDIAIDRLCQGVLC